MSVKVQCNECDALRDPHARSTYITVRRADVDWHFCGAACLARRATEWARRDEDVPRPLT